MPFFKVAILCVWVRVRWWRSGGSVNEVCMAVTGCGDGCVGVGWVCVWGVGGWMSEFWLSGTVYMLILTICMSYSILCLTQFGQKVD